MKLFNFLLIFTVFLGLKSYSQSDIYTLMNTEIKLFSKAPLENIEAINRTANMGIVNFKMQSFVFKVPVKFFYFVSERMEKQFNSPDYMESNKFQYASFRGKIIENIDINKEGTYNIYALGNMEIHGVTRERKIPATVTIKDGKIKFVSKFKVKLLDYNMRIPKFFMRNISEEIDITVNSDLIPFNINKK